jgi:cyclopropane-fatty-acyl-phospholipid synthase
MWDAKFTEKWPEIKKSGYDEAFYRKWHYYFKYCEVAFDTRTIGNLRILWTRPANRTLNVL